jgi:hypothetical protein
VRHLDRFYREGVPCVPCCPLRQGAPSGMAPTSGADEPNSNAHRTLCERRSHRNCGLPRPGVDLGRRSTSESDGPLSSALRLRPANCRRGEGGAPRRRCGAVRQNFLWLNSLRSLIGLRQNVSPIPPCGHRPTRSHHPIHRNGSIRRPGLRRRFCSIQSIHRSALGMLPTCPFLHASRHSAAPRRRDDQAGGNQQASDEFRRAKVLLTATPRFSSPWGPPRAASRPDDPQLRGQRRRRPSWAMRTQR